MHAERREPHVRFLQLDWVAYELMKAYSKFLLFLYLHSRIFSRLFPMPHVAFVCTLHKIASAICLAMGLEGPILFWQQWTYPLG